MPQERLSNEEFFTRLTALLSVATYAHKSSVYLTQKPLESGTSILIRATNGDDKKDKKIKVATVVELEDLEGFFTKYAEVCKGNMGSLKKRDRKKRREKLKGKKKGTATGGGAAAATPTTA